MDVVKAGYEAIAEAYHARRNAREATSVAWLDGLKPLLPASGTVVDLGCGSGVPVTRYFADRGYEVTGYDLSPAMLAIAGREVPRASFVEARMEELIREPGSVDLLVSMFAIIHVPRDEHAGLFRRMWSWLPPDGAALLSLGVSDNPDQYDESWHGAPMSWSHFDASTTCELLRGAGFDLRWSAIEETAPGERHLFVVAGKQGAPQRR